MVDDVGRRVAEWWRDIGKPLWKDPAKRAFVLQFVAFVLVAILAAETLIVLAPILWAWLMQTPGYAGAHEPSLRFGALVLAALLAFWLLYRLIDLVRRGAARQLRGRGSEAVTPERVARTIWLLIILLVVESLAAETLIELAAFTPLGGVALWLVPLLLFGFLAVVLVLLAMATLYRAERLIGTRFVNRIEQASQRPDSWPAEVVIAALSTPGEHLLKKRKAELRRYRHFAAPTVAQRFELFADPKGLAPAINQNALQVESFLEGFNWRQLALAYGEQLSASEPLSEPMPQLILLCSKESAEHQDDFAEFFDWLLEPLQAADPAMLSERLLRFHPTAVDFEDLESIETVLTGVYREACDRHGAPKVVIDITGAQRPWTLAAVGATLGSGERILSYVAQQSFDRAGKDAWVRYYNIEGISGSMADPANEQLGAG